MPVRNLTDVSVESLNRLVRDINDEIQHVSARAVNLQGRGITGAAPGRRPTDYVTRGQLDQLRSEMSALGREALSRGRTRKVVQQGGIGTSTLPAPTHPIGFGYYLVDRPSQGDPDYGDFYSEVTGYTNLYHAWAQRGYGNSDTTLQQWQASMAESLARAAGDSKWIHIDAGPDDGPTPQATFDNTLRAVEMAGFSLVWPKVQTFGISDEGVSTASRASNLATQLRNKLRARNLPDPPLGIGLTLTLDQITNTNTTTASGIQWIGCECYVDPPGNSNSQVNIDQVNATMDLYKSAVPSSKQIAFIMMAYARNGDPASGTYGWPNFQTLADLQEPVYLKSYNDDRIIEILMFSYGRYSGTRDIGRPLLVDRHKNIGAAILGLGGQQQTLGCSKPSSGGILAQTYVDLMDIALSQAIPGGIVQDINGTPYVIAGNEQIFRQLVLDVWNQDYTMMSAKAHPEGGELIIVQRRDDNSFSETYAIFASDLRVRPTENAFIEVCRPAA